MKKRILVICYALLLCATASLAWLSDFQPNVVEDLRVEFQDGALTVVNLDFDAYIEAPNSEGAFERVPDGNQEGEEYYLFNKKQMVPDSITPFKIKIKNTSTTESRKAKIGVAIRLDPEEMKDVNILDVIYLDMVAGDGFDTTNNYHVFLRLNAAEPIGAEDSGEYFLWAYGDGEEITIPPTKPGTEYVTLDCSFYYDQEATAEYQNKSIQAIAFRLE